MGTFARCKSWSPALELPTPPVGPRLCVDERIVRKILRVNPAMRQGRTTGEVKEALDNGESLLRPVDQRTILPGLKAADLCSPAGAEPPNRYFEDALAFFLSGQKQHLNTILDDISERRAALEAEEQQAKATARSRVLAFVSMLDATLISSHIATALASQTDFLAQLVLSPGQILEMLAARSPSKVQP